MIHELKLLSITTKMFTMTLSSPYYGMIQSLKSHVPPKFELERYQMLSIRK